MQPDHDVVSVDSAGTLRLLGGFHDEDMRPLVGGVVMLTDAIDLRRSRTGDAS